ncbi:MAG: hypothetical protein WDA16_06415 [Candidatus Thermoplasmatota archaeon]
MLQIQDTPWIRYDRAAGRIVCDHCHTVQGHGRTAGLPKLHARLQAFAREHRHTSEARA